MRSDRLKSRFSPTLPGMTVEEKWSPDWGPTLSGVLTVHDVDGGWSALLHGSEEGSIQIQREDHGRLDSLFALATGSVLAASESSTLTAQGGLPMTDIADLLHHGLTELWRMARPH